MRLSRESCRLNDIIAIFTTFKVMVNIFYCNTRQFDSRQFGHFLSQLPRWMQVEILKYKVEKSRILRMAARLLLREALTSTGNEALFQRPWVRDKRQKPSIAGWGPFSISYSNDYTVLAFTKEEPVGIDIEHVTSIDIETVVPLFCQDEKDHILNAADKRESFYRIWVKKEAILKAMGVGITAGLDLFSSTGDSVKYDSQCWHWTQLPIAGGYICYMCTQQKYPELDITAPLIF
jgi:4'-phosphopantetheinyl transferase